MTFSDVRAIPETMIGALHQKWVTGRRAQILAAHLAGLIPTQARILDVGLR